MMVLVKEGRGEGIKEQVNPRSHTSLVCLPPVLCACSNTSLMSPPTLFLFSPACCSAGVTRFQMKRQSTAESDKCIISDAGSSHWQEVHSVCSIHPGNCPLDWTLWTWVCSQCERTKLCNILIPLPQKLDNTRHFVHLVHVINGPIRTAKVYNLYTHSVRLDLHVTTWTLTLKVTKWNQILYSHKTNASSTMLTKRETQCYCVQLGQYSLISIAAQSQSSIQS